MCILYYYTINIRTSCNFLQGVTFLLLMKGTRFLQHCFRWTRTTARPSLNYIHFCIRDRTRQPAELWAGVSFCLLHLYIYIYTKLKTPCAWQTKVIKYSLPLNHATLLWRLFPSSGGNIEILQGDFFGLDMCF